MLAVGTRLGDFTTGSWTVFGNEDLRIVGLNAARFDAAKHRSLPLVADALEGLEALGSALGRWTAPQAWRELADSQSTAYGEHVRAAVAPRPGATAPSYAQVIAAVNAEAGSDDYAVSAAGGLPGELNVNWLSRGVATFDCEYGFSCMLRARQRVGRMARARGEGRVRWRQLVPDAPLRLLAPVISSHKLIASLATTAASP